MSLTSITPAQRATLSGTLQNAGKATTDFTENSKALAADRAAEILPVVQKAVDALTVAGLASAPLPATSAVVANGATVAVRNSAGANSHNGTAVVAASAVTGINLPATAAMVDNAQALTGVAPTGTYTNTVTFTVANGVITGIALS